MSINKHKKYPAGVTLIELTISIAIFSVVMMIALDSFLNVLKFNREAVQKQSIQDHTEFLFGLMGREVRMARINYGDYSGNNSCDGYFANLTPSAKNPTWPAPQGSVKLNGTYAVTFNPPVGGGDNPSNSKELRFQNYEGLCVRYFLATDANDTTRLAVSRHNPQAGIVWDFNPNETREDWVLPGDIEVADIYFNAQNMFDQHATDGTGPTQPPAVKYSIALRSSIWNPSDIKIFNVIAGRNFEQF
jgi:prepilin-type N-terminal cleavage/methylation domain-containing protein